MVSSKRHAALKRAYEHVCRENIDLLDELNKCQAELKRLYRAIADAEELLKSAGK